MSPKALVLILALALAPLAQAQHSPYAGQHTRDIKALSAQEQAELLAGEGMGLAKAAELNGYPGPAHVIQLAEPLQLSHAQLASSQRLMAEHKAAARGIGTELLEAERALDRAFATRRADADAVRQLTDDIGRLQARLRFEHLRTHLAQTALLQPAQIARYAQLRGYTGASATSHGSHQH